LAFRPAAHSCGREREIVANLRAAGALTVSLVAVEAGEIVGHVALSPIELPGAVGAWHGLGPISVLPARQRSGVGTALMTAALQRLEHLGSVGCVLVGDPAFYHRFGFANDPAITVDGVPPEYTLARRFQPDPARGAALFHRAFLDAMQG
jgi:putative acetyltransferase